MIRYLLEMFGVSLALTLVIELAAGWIMGLRSRKKLLLIVLVNVLTNPAAVLICWLGAPQIPVEIIVILAEAWVYFWFSKDPNWTISHPAWTSVIANGLSWLIGFLLGGIL